MTHAAIFQLASLASKHQLSEREICQVLRLARAAHPGEQVVVTTIALIVAGVVEG